VLVGHETSDDAAVYRLSDGEAIVETVDFFTPVVDDPFTFGRIAAANALSDIWAMGARPLFALNLVGFPVGKLHMDVLGDILRGGADAAQEAGVPILGGHSIDDPEPKYGMAVTGIVHPDRILRNVGARPGDRLILTKPLGSGIVTTAIKRGVADAALVDRTVAVMAALNRAAGEALAASGAVHALTDVTGFALAGHGHEVAHASGLALEIAWESVPLLPGAASYARGGFVPGGTGRNEDYYERFVTFRRALSEWERKLLFDPQTSGGLLACVAAGSAAAIVADLEAAGESVARIGTAGAGEPGAIVVV